MNNLNLPIQSEPAYTVRHRPPHQQRYLHWDQVHVITGVFCGQFKVLYK